MGNATRTGRAMIIVLGMHRSGTSLCANMLHALGVDMADDPGLSPSNKRGHWERPRINDLNDAVFALFGRAWSDAAHGLALPEHWLNDPRVQAIRRDLVGFIGPRLGAASAWGFKDPRTARLLPLWRQVLADLQVQARFVLCVRDPTQVARSLSARDRLGAAQAEYRWLQYMAGAVAGIAEDPVCVVPYESWFTDPDALLARLARVAGLETAPSGLVDKIADGTLRHDDAVREAARPLAARLHRLVTACAPENRLSPETVSLARIVLDCEQQIQPMLVEAEILRASVAEQNRVLSDLNNTIRDLRRPS